MKLVLLYIIFCSWADFLLALDPIYRLEGHPDQYYSQTLEFPALSIIICSAICSTKNGGFFFFQDGICKVHDASRASPPTNGQSRKYYFYDPSLPPQTLTDMAFEKPTAGGYYSTLTTARVVDGDLSTQFHSDTKIDPWWSVDLEATYIIRDIDILPHTGVPDWFRAIKVFVGFVEVTNGDFSSYTEVGDYPGPYSGTNRLSFIPPTLTAGRYVVIQGFSGIRFLALYDVKMIDFLCNIVEKIDKVGHRSVIQYLHIKGLTLKEIHDDMGATLRDNAPSYSMENY